MSARLISLDTARRLRGLPPARFVEVEAPAGALLPVREGDAMHHIATGAIGYVEAVTRAADGSLLELRVRMRYERGATADVQGGAA